MVLYRLFFIASLLLILSLKEMVFTALFLAVLLLLSYKQALYITKRAVKSLLFFNLSVSLGYFIVASLKGIDPYHYIFYINLKVFTITYFVFYFFHKINMVEFFAFSKDLSFLLMITLSQIISYKKTYEDFTLAYKARVIKKLHSREKKFILRVFEFFFSKALKDSKERTLAMKARGFF
ncbi:hypothetical protein LCX93_05095 [Sulfurimonas sp. SWIR-19]|uniref:hypothetical protein n=1 Tax=Sulfurimonas sp. SWIR-19 TaxID=2878390 RepID=UPI001CF43974|nr:hypothetical protein [Sulfurimonas sp. SWIR-19]UCN01295.1 hypothetical protein LCX93_05095 [Sulfurimonas sp. SWIR-19]